MKFPPAVGEGEVAGSGKHIHTQITGAAKDTDCYKISMDGFNMHALPKKKRRVFAPPTHACGKKKEFPATPKIISKSKEKKKQR